MSQPQPTHRIPVVVTRSPAAPALMRLDMRIGANSWFELASLPLGEFGLDESNTELGTQIDLNDTSIEIPNSPQTPIVGLRLVRIH